MLVWFGLCWLLVLGFADDDGNGPFNASLSSAATVVVDAACFEFSNHVTRRIPATTAKFVELVGFIPLQHGLSYNTLRHRNTLNHCTSSLRKVMRCGEGWVDDDQQVDPGDYGSTYRTRPFSTAADLCVI